ncbi:unnamed protein product [Durusdinium trenchii]|uniref:Uncharacterized protein n=2 Tax=Durusdinium trenchii TaxID=1381693 RepID=A0ABP0RVJ8_9DINO
MTSASQPCKKQRVEGPSGPSVLTFFPNGTFRRVPGSSNESSEVSVRERKQITTVFSADGRFVHLQKPYTEVEPLKTGNSANADEECAGDQRVQVWSIGGPENPFASPAPKSWLESRLERAKSQPPPISKRDAVATADTVQPPNPSADVMVELRVAQKSPHAISESAARLRINAPSAEVLDKVLTESMGNLLSVIKPSLS